MKINRNAPCECGSGRKAKHCCGTNSTNKTSIFPIVALIAVGGLVIAGIFSGSDEPDSNASRSGVSTQAPVPTAPAAQPGPAPEGKVWSAEHGHWHDASPVQIQSDTPSPVQIQTNAPPSASGLTASTDARPPVDGEERNGMIWNAEHDHWHQKEGAPATPQQPSPPISRHDIPRVTIGGGTATQGFNPVPQPPGPVPPGKVWSTVHGHWHDAEAPATSEAPSTDSDQPQ